MRTRILTPNEWRARLEGTELLMLLPYVAPENVDVVVVEEGEEIVASLAVMRTTHYEGVWISPEHEGLGTTRALLRDAGKIARGRGERFVFGGASDARMNDILQRMGGVRMPLDFYALNIGGNQECRQQ